MYIRSGSTKGAADISAIVNGKAIEIEIKFGKDKLRPAQIEYQKSVEAAGGVYFVAKSFDGFLSEISKHI